MFLLKSALYFYKITKCYSQKTVTPYLYNRKERKVNEKSIKRNFIK